MSSLIGRPHKSMVWVLLLLVPGISDDLISIFADPDEAYEFCQEMNDAQGFDSSDYLSNKYHVEMWGVF